MRAATLTPEPELLPPGARWTARSHGFQGVPMCVFVPHAPIANSTVRVLPMTMRPASMSRRASVAVTGDTRDSQTFEPPVVTRPSISMMSLSATGTPWNLPAALPARRAESASRAAARASSAYTSTKAPSRGSSRSIRASSVSTSRSEVRSPAASASAAAHALRYSQPSTVVPPPSTTFSSYQRGCASDRRGTWCQPVASRSRRASHRERPRTSRQMKSPRDFMPRTKPLCKFDSSGHALCAWRRM